MYWAQALSEQNDNLELQAKFSPIAQQLSDHEHDIITQLNAAQGPPVDIGGYYHPDKALLAQVMRPSQTFNAIIASI